MFRPTQEPAIDTLQDIDLAGRMMSVAPEIDMAAEAEFCRRLAPRLQLYARKHLRNTSSAADLVHDVLIVTLQRLRAGELREPQHVTSFIFGVCRQMVLDRQRSQGRRDQILEHFGASLPVAAEPEDPPDLERLQRCLQRLSERERTVILLSFFEERPALDVGQELGVTEQNVRVIRHRSIERLRHCMGGAGRLNPSRERS